MASRVCAPPLSSASTADAKKLTEQAWADWQKDIDLQMEVERYQKAFGHQHADRADR